MRKRALQLLLALFALTFVHVSHSAEHSPKIVVLGFTLHDMTDLPNAPEEQKRIDLLTRTFTEQLRSKGVSLLPMSGQSATEMARHSPTYFYDNTDTAVALNKDTGADYLVIGVAMKPTYLFVYPRLLMVDMRTRKVVMSKAAQLESSWSDENTTIRTGEKLAQMVKDRLNLLQRVK